ncbi:MAG: hypothetical protein ACYC46_04210 [Acidobacteriaceae bacterium]
MNGAFELLTASIGAAFCWVLWFYFLKKQREDSFREELFEIRAELFNLAASGEISFDNRSYVELRYLINGMLRFGHRISLTSSLIASSLADRDAKGTTAYHRWKESLDKLPDNTKHRLNELHERMFKAYMKHLVRGSAILSLIAVYFVAKATFTALFGYVFRPNRNTHFDVIDIAVNNIANSFNTTALEETAYTEQSNAPDLLTA